jgi:hypothetical protein
MSGMSRRPQRSLKHQFVAQLVWIALVLAVFYAFLTLGGPRIVGEWLAGFWQPG